MRIRVLAVNNLVCVEMMQHGMFPSWTQSGLEETLLEMQAGHNSWKQGCWEMPGAPHLLQTHSGRWTVALLCCDNPVPFATLLLYPWAHQWPWAHPTAALQPAPHTSASGCHLCPGALTFGKENKSVLKHLGECSGNRFFYSLCKLHLQLEHTRLFVRGILLLEIMSQFSAKCKSAGCL